METNELSIRLQGLGPKPSTKDLLNGIKPVEKTDKALIILLDGSGSMDSYMETSTKIDIAWRVFKQDLMPNMTGWTYGVILFNDYTHWTVFPQTDTRALTTLNSPSAQGSTYMGQALLMAWSWAKTHAKEARFIILSDGLPNDMLPDQILAMVRENSGIPIDTVGIGKGDGYDYDPEFLREVSRITGGVFTEVSDVKLLSDTIKKLSPAERPLLGTV